MHENMREIRTAVREVRETNLQVYQMVLEMQTTLPSQVKRQQSVYFLDAWGRFSPFHLEFINSWDAFLAVLKVRFKHCGLGKIEKNQYVLEEANSKRPIDIRYAVRGKHAFYPDSKLTWICASRNGVPLKIRAQFANSLKVRESMKL